jgi:hypothetical protein
MSTSNLANYSNKSWHHKNKHARREEAATTMRFTANFLLSLANLVIIYSCPARADEPCDSTFEAALGSLVFGDDCAAVDGTCPTSCGDLFAGVYIVCKGNTLTDEDTGDEVPFSAATPLLGFGSLLDEGCEDARSS